MVRQAHHERRVWPRYTEVEVETAVATRAEWAAFLQLRSIMQEQPSPDPHRPPDPIDMPPPDIKPVPPPDIPPPAGPPEIPTRPDRGNDGVPAI